MDNEDLKHPVEIKALGKNNCWCIWFIEVVEYGVTPEGDEWVLLKGVSYD